MGGCLIGHARHARHERVAEPISAADHASGALSAIGNTPLLPLLRAWPGPGSLVAKAEFLQPGGSIKDRVALEIVRTARWSGRLRAGGHVVEMTSGNIGAGLAVVCNVLGHPLAVTMSAGNSAERATMLRALGAEVVLVDQVDGRQGEVTGDDIAAAIDLAREIAELRDGFFVNQFHNPGAVSAHERTTGPEIWRQTEGQLDAFVAAVGTGGTFVGVARFLSRVAHGVLRVAVEPEGASVLGGGTVTKPRHVLQGTGYGRVPPQWQPELLDLSLSVGDQQAAEMKLRLAHLEGLHVGYSAAANVAASVALLPSGRLRRDAIVATLLPDIGFKYS
jgi:cysteine synthase